MQPEFIFGSTTANSQQNNIFVGLMLLVAMGHALNMNFIHSLSKTINPFVNIFYTHVSLVFLNSFMCNLYPETPHLQGTLLGFAILLCALLITNLFTQYGIILANSIKPPSQVMPFGYVSVLLGFCADVYLFDTKFGILSIIGMILTSCGLLSGFLLATRSQPKEEKGSLGKIVEK